MIIVIIMIILILVTILIYCLACGTITIILKKSC